MMVTARRSWYLKQDALAYTVKGDPFSTWAGPVSFATSVEYRRESADVVADPISAANGCSIGAQIPLHGGVEVLEGFGELVIPLLKEDRKSTRLNSSH